MAKKLFILCFVLVFFIPQLCSGQVGFSLSQGIFGNITGALAEVETTAESVRQVEVAEGIYTPRILPDHPLYFVKRSWEEVRLFFTFNRLAKAKYLLNLAEKRVAEAKALVLKGKSEKVEKSLKRYEKTLNKVMEQVRKAEKKGQDVEEVIANVSEATLRHQKTLATVWEKVPEPAQKVIEKVIEASKKGCEQAIEAIKSPEKRQELIEKAKGIKALFKEKVEGFQKTLEEGLEKFEEAPLSPADEGEEAPTNTEGGKVKALDTERLEKEGEKILPTPEIFD